MVYVYKTFHLKKLWYDVKSMRVFEGSSTMTFTDITLSTVSRNKNVIQSNKVLELNFLSLLDTGVSTRWSHSAV